MASDRPVPWIEKYRPRTLNDVSSQKETVAVLKKTIESGNLPHLLFYGTPGTGKTSTILAVARDMFGVDRMRSRVLELNASDERGIDVVREKVKNFAKTSVGASKDCPPFKLIILDEADSLTTEAQSALRRMMETYSTSTRFCLICNYITRIIEPLASRCSKFRFKPLDPSSIKARLKEIVLAENCSVSDDAIDTLVTVSEGDMRRAVQYLETGSTLNHERTLTSEMITEISGVIPQEFMKEMVEAWKSRDFQNIRHVITKAVRSGYSGTQLLTQLHETILLDIDLTSRQKSRISQTLAHVDKALVDGADEELQLTSLLIAAF